MKTVVGVMAEAPLAGRCKPRLLAVHGADWVAGLYAAMLRDVLDGLQSIDADDYVVFASPLPTEPGGDDDEQLRTQAAMDVLARHVPAPWRIVAQKGGSPGERALRAFEEMLSGGGARAVLAFGDAPSFPTSPLEAALDGWGADAGAILGPTENGTVYLLATNRAEPLLLRDVAWETPALLETARARCRELSLPVRELPEWYVVDEPSDVLQLLDELRKHPDRAPRTAQFLVTRA